MNRNTHFLIVGLGLIGGCYARRLTALGYTVDALDIDPGALDYAKEEGIIAAIESSHAVAHLMKIAPTMSKDQIIICCLSGRGDKDVAAIARYRGRDLHE